MKNRINFKVVSYISACLLFAFLMFLIGSNFVKDKQFDYCIEEFEDFILASQFIQDLYLDFSDGGNLTFEEGFFYSYNFSYYEIIIDRSNVKEQVLDGYKESKK